MTTTPLKQKLIKIDMVFGLLALACSIIFIYFFPDQEKHRSSLAILREYVFMNSTHVLFTFILIIAFSSVRMSLSSWAKHVYKNEKLGITLIPLLIFSLFFITSPSLQNYQLNQIFRFVFAPIVFFIPYMHIVRQQFGLMRNYFPNSKVTLLKHGHILMLCLYVLYRLIISKVNVMDSFWHLNLSLKTSFVLEMICLNSMFLIALFISLEALFGSKEHKLLYFSYSLRFFIYPFATQSFAGQFVLGAVHGFEYALFLIPIMHKQRKFKFTWNTAAKILTLATLIAVVLKGPKSFGGDGASDSSIGVQIWATVFVTFTFIHYLIDSLIFRSSRHENISFTKLLKH